MKTIEVVAAIIIKNGEVFATQRGYGEFKGWWEFPGGKIESGECAKEALVREIREELVADISVGELLETVEWDYPNFHLTMHAKDLARRCSCTCFVSARLLAHALRIQRELIKTVKCFLQELLIFQVLYLRST